jgi:aspartyl-tRNA(Asn)/glutamyl-tRNA(Gln) amidotransferase subunit A
MNPLDLDAPSLATAVRTGQLDPVECVQSFLAQIRQQNPAVNALVDHDEAAPVRDAAMLRRRIAAGEALPLAGVPVVIKDSIWVAGRRITQGSPLFAGFIPDRSALPVERLQAAGAVVIGIGNMPEFGAKEVTENRLYGRTLNPRDLTRTPGGSSGGCAAALAADMAPLALGGDGGGSCRRPPAHVGVVGFKPSSGTVADPWGFPGTLPGIACTCPMGRTVPDVAACFAVIAGQHPADVLSIDPGPPLARSASSLRVAFSPRLGLDCPVDQDVLDTVAAAVETLRRAGLPVTEADPAWPMGTTEEAILAIEEAGLAAFFGDKWLADPALFDPHVGWQIERGLRRTGAEVAAAHAASLGIAATMAAFFTEWDLLLCPTLACVAWPADQLNPSLIGGAPARHRGHAVFTPLFNHARTPALTLPCGAGAHGLPLGLQVIGPRLADHAVLQAGIWMEQALGPAARPWLVA